MQSSALIHHQAHHFISVLFTILHFFFREIEFFSNYAVITKTLKGISERYEIVNDEVGFDQNHIHILCGAPPRMVPLRVISIIKSITARELFEKFPSLKKRELWGGQFWNDGKYIGTVGEATSEKTIRNYIKNQSADKKKSAIRMKQLKLFKF